VKSKGGMKMPELQTKKGWQEVKATKEKELIGTLLSVFGVGAFIVLSWVAVYLLYLLR
jgi:hypothetical protein